MIEVFLKTQVSRLIREIVPKDKKGAILLEFAFSIPILITCLYYATDVPQAFRMSNKTQWMCELYAQSAINLLNFKEDKRLNTDDLQGLSKLIACCITGSPENADLKGLKIEVDVAASIQGAQLEKSAEGEYIIDRITGEYKKFSELGYRTKIDKNDPSTVWVNYQYNLYSTNVGNCRLFFPGDGKYCWHDGPPGYFIDYEHDDSNEPGGEVRVEDDPPQWALYLARTRYALPKGQRCEISTDAKGNICVEIGRTGWKTSIPPGKLMISTSIKSDKLFYMLPIKTIGTKESITVSLPM